MLYLKPVQSPDIVRLTSSCKCNVTPASYTILGHTVVTAFQKAFLISSCLLNDLCFYIFWQQIICHLQCLCRELLRHFASSESHEFPIQCDGQPYVLWLNTQLPRAVFNVSSWCGSSIILLPFCFDVQFRVAGYINYVLLLIGRID